VSTEKGENGRAPEAPRASLREVAKTAGVALSSASRVLSGHPDVSEAMRERVLAAAESLGYEPNLLWQGLRSGSTQTIGVVFRDISSSLISSIALAAERVLQEHGYSVLLSNTRGLAELDVTQIRLLDQRRVDGLLVMPNDIQDPETISALERLRVPFVAIDRDLPTKLGGGAVLIDHAAGVRRAAELLLSLGHRSVGFVAPPASLRPATVVTATLHEVFDPVGATVRVEIGPFEAEHGAAAMERLLEGPDPVTAVLSGSSQMFHGVLGALRARGLRIPDDVSVVALEDTPLLSLLEPPFTAVSRHPSLVGEEAAQILLEMLAGANPTARTTPTDFIERGSCAPPRS
jgi:LacI family transcriptional regulator